ncbi:hypothetical protein H9L39_07215 [Fusarium oxysporum f. sp. albedinis]|nr:hypothetical protein H9L39_07215 [Fusarium oxysporum f. sp. albedinis]
MPHGKYPFIHVVSNTALHTDFSSASHDVWSQDLSWGVRDRNSSTVVLSMLIVRYNLDIGHKILGELDWTSSCWIHRTV